MSRGKLENSLLLKLLNLLARNSSNDSNFVKIEFERSIMDLLQEPRLELIEGRAIERVISLYSLYHMRLLKYIYIYSLRSLSFCSN